MVPGTTGEGDDAIKSRRSKEENNGESMASWFIKQCLTSAFFENTWEKSSKLWRAEAMDDSPVSRHLIDPVRFMHVGTHVELYC